jgi:hypothetical protein
MDEIAKSDVGCNEVAVGGLDNIDECGNKVGRPLNYKSLKEFKKKVEEYFTYCDARKTTIIDKQGVAREVKNPKPYTLAGLAEFLDIDRKTLLNYSYRDEFFPTISRAKRKCEAYANEQLFEGNDRGAKFSLMNNFDGYNDKQETILTGPDGGPIQAQAVPFSYQDFANLSPDDRQKIEDAARIMESLKNR